jgi:alpha-ketoglutarate-dependent taurine dioxygenase
VTNFSSPPIAGLERRKPRLPRSGQIVAEPLRPDSHLPLVVRPGGPGFDPLAWGLENRAFVEESLLRHGGILFRELGIQDMSDFQELARTVGGDLLEYKYRSTPRTAVGASIYTSTEYPADQEIPQHNENSYSRSWPMKVFFYCEKAADEGGMTPISDSHRVYERVPPTVRERFVEKGVMYVRNYGEGIDLAWQQVFQTEDPAEVEQFCRRAGIDFEWRDGGRLRTRQVCQAVASHPKSGKMVWFNQAHLFHVSNLEPQVRNALLGVFDEEDLPRNAYYGDGSPIEPEALAEVREAYRQEQVAFPWQQGDVLLLDNMAVAHGRTPFRGERRVRVAMTEPVAGRELET